MPVLEDDGYRLILLATLEEARQRLSDAIDALHSEDAAAFASAVAAFTTVRRTAQAWHDGMEEEL
jgi:hypothetical protein